MISTQELYHIPSGLYWVQPWMPVSSEDLCQVCLQAGNPNIQIQFSPSQNVHAGTHHIDSSDTSSFDHHQWSHESTS